MANYSSALAERLSDFTKTHFIDYRPEGYVGNSWGTRYLVPGWEGATAGIYGDVRLGASQQGIKNLEPASWGIREPLRLGHFMWLILKMPAFFHREIVDVFRFVFQDMVKEVSGIPQNSIGVITQQFGAVGQSADYPGIYQEQGKEVTVKTCEFRGSLTRKLMDYWVGGISDRETGFSTMYGKDIPFVRSAYSASFLYVILGAQGRVEDIEYACIFHECWPSDEVTSHLSTVTLGDAGSVSDVDIKLSGIFQRGPEVDILAQLMVAAFGVYSETALDQTLPSWAYNLYFGYADANREAFRRAISVSHKDRIQMYIEDTKDSPSEISWTQELYDLREGVQNILGSEDSPVRLTNAYLGDDKDRYATAFDKAYDRARTPWTERSNGIL